MRCHAGSPWSGSRTARAKLHSVATPITRGRRTQVWEARVLDEEEKVVATGRVRLLCIEADQQLAGETVTTPLHRPK